MENAVEKGRPKQRRYRAAAIILSALLTIAVATSCIYWFRPFMENYYETDEAKVSGTLTAIPALTGGTIREIRVRVGEYVKTGDVVAVLTSEQAEAQAAQAGAALDLAVAQRLKAVQGAKQQELRQAEEAVRQAGASSEFSQKSLERIKALAAVEAASQSQVDQAIKDETGAGAALESARARLELLQSEPSAPDLAVADAQVGVAQAAARLAVLNLENLKVKAPQPGVVVRVNLHQGEAVNPGQPLLTIWDNSDLRVDVQVEEKKVEKIKTGQKAEVWLDAHPGRRFEGKVAEVTPATPDVFSFVSLEGLGSAKTPKKVPVSVVLDAQGLPVPVGTSASVKIYFDR